MAFWRIAADLRWTGDFFISSGLLSHWQIWLAAAAILLGVATLLNRLGNADEVDLASTKSAPLQKIESHSVE
jgi:hypothetical protein